MSRRELDWAAIFRMIGLLVTVVLIAVTGTVYWAATHPGAAWTTFVQPRLFSKDTQIRNTTATLNVKKISWTEWTIEWAVTGLQIDRQTPALHVAGDAKVSGTLRLWTPVTEFQIREAEFKAEGAPLVYQSSGSEGAVRSPFQIADELRHTLVRLARYVRMDKLNISIRELQIGTPSKDAQPSKWKLSAVKPGVKDPQAAELKVEGQASGASLKLSSQIRLDQIANGSPFLKSEFEAVAKEWGAKGQLDVGASEVESIATLKASGNYGKIKGALDTQISLNRAALGLRGKTDLEQLPGPVPEIKGLDWTFQVPIADNQVFSTQPGNVTASGPVSLFFVKKEVREQIEGACKCKFPDRLNATVEGSLWPSHILDRSGMEMPVANVKIGFEPILNSMMTLNLSGTFTVLNDRENKLQYWPVLETHAKFSNFQSVKAILESNKIVVPSPFDILGGTIEVTSKATLAPNDKNMIVIPAEVKLNLSSPSQKVRMAINFSATIPSSRKSMDLYANFNIDDLILELPPMDPIHGLPKIVKDTRLLAEPVPEDDKEFKLRFIYDVRTSKPGAIQLLSKMAKPAIPISVDVDRTKAGDTRGLIKAEPFELNYMHRTLFVDGLRVILDDRETADFAVDGRLRMEQSQYKVNILVSGTIRSPLIKLTSEPELGRSDIISVILYDRTSDQLVAADRETVGVFDTAVADRAIGLLGLWVFASTPIRSFHYNPATKVYTATVNLSEGTTASLGTDWEEAAQVEVRKRVTKRWVLTASWKPGTEDKSQSGKLVLQWEKRF